MQRKVLSTDFWLIRAIKLAPWEATACYSFIQYVLDYDNNIVLITAFLLLLFCSAIGLSRFTSVNKVGQIIIMSISFVLWALCLTKTRISDTFIGVDGNISYIFSTNIPYVILALFVATTSLLFPNTLKSLISSLKSLRSGNAINGGSHGK